MAWRWKSADQVGRCGSSIPLLSKTYFLIELKAYVRTITFCCLSYYQNKVISNLHISILYDTTIRHYNISCHYKYTYCVYWLTILKHQNYVTDSLMFTLLNGLFASEFQQMVEGELQIMGFQQLENFNTCVLGFTY